MKRLGFLLAVSLMALTTLAPPAMGKDKLKVRIGYFPNITHSQALVGFGKGVFDRALGSGVDVQPIAFNAGPSAIEALFAGSVDISYIGPNPSINGYVQSGGKALRIIAGATSGGASFVVRSDSGIRGPKDLAGKKLATPQLGNTQDVAMRNYLVDNGLKPKEKGGNVEVVPIANPDQLTLFKKRELDGAWAPEPWATRLVKEAGGRILLDERTLWPGGKFVTANVIVGTDFLRRHRDVVEDFLKAHVQLTLDIARDPGRYMTIINDGIEKATGKGLPMDVLEEAFSRMDVTYDPLQATLFKSAESAFDAGFLGGRKPDLSKIYDLDPLNDVLRRMGLKTIK